MCVHELIVNELFERKSLAALIFLIEHGRELEFVINEKEYFISCSNATKYVSLWEKESEQSFNNVCELIETAKIDDVLFYLAWDKAELTCLL